MFPSVSSTPMALLALLATTQIQAFTPTTTTKHAMTINKVRHTASCNNRMPLPFLPPSTTRQTMAMIPPGLTEMDNTHLADFIHASSTLLADASEAVADVAADANEKVGWWGQYLQTFKGILVWVHSQVDQPLRDMGITQTWGISIAIFTAGVRASLVPLSIQQSKSSEYVKALKPYQDEIKKKFADNKEMQNRAIAKLFEDSGTNPLAGCLVSLAQLPIFLGLYRSVTLLAKDGQLNEPFLWIPSLEGPVSAPTYRGMEWLTQGWHMDGSLPVPGMGWETTLAFLVMPVVLVLGQSFTMSTLTPPLDESASDEEKAEFEKSQGILKFLPLLIGYFSLQVPAGLTIYWLTSNSFTLAQSLSVKAYYKANPPEIDLPEYWDALDDVANMSPEERRKAAEAGFSTGPKFDDLLDEARFHYVVQRHPLREESPAWKRAQESSSVPAEFTDWVNGATVASTNTKEKATADA